MVAPAIRQATPAASAAATLISIHGASTKAIITRERRASTVAPRRMDVACLLGRNDPITLPAPSAVMKIPDQSAEWPNDRASAGPSTKMGSAATVTAATMSSRTMIRRSFCRAIPEPVADPGSVALGLARSGGPASPQPGSGLRVKKPYESAFRGEGPAEAEVGEAQARRIPEPGPGPGCTTPSPWPRRALGPRSGAPGWPTVTDRAGSAKVKASPMASAPPTSQARVSM